ncbi:hypothetical protein [Paenarthrobacter nitroguajacolicus]|uniref:hypothetical protein n=1 Tax=Paenarthrobacter nitroguajacolicus TaxID=211146 RepID=UPI00248BB1AB|nr:hypothetical protein [Paenarthrobacter nitroguajacolicus]MDI2033292.1 hypothetical protein [Paenarthrobacter nitroguajacolicus]
MYIGHYAAAAVILAVAPEAPVLPIAVAVAWPDIVWPALVFAGKESVHVDRDDPLQSRVKFTSYPYSHSLVLGSVISLVPALLAGAIYQSVFVGALFWIGVLSHWLLDAVVHLRDLPVLGWGSDDRRVGLGLWARPRLAFALEYTFFAVTVLLVAPQTMFVGLLGGGLLLHLFNINSFFGFTKKNPVGTPKRFATLALVGYIFAIIWFMMSWR